MSRSSTHIRKTENEFVIIWIHNDILHIKYKPDTSIDLAVANEVLVFRLCHQNGRIYPVICYVNGIVDYNKCARDYTFRTGFHRISAISFVASDFFPRNLINSSLSELEYFIPAKLTSSTEEALEFLTQYKRNNMQ